MASRLLFGANNGRGEGDTHVSAARMLTEIVGMKTSSEPATSHVTGTVQPQSDGLILLVDSHCFRE